MRNIYIKLMSEHINNDSEGLDKVLQQYTNLKKNGTPCLVKEARTFYYNMWKHLKEEYCKVCATELMNFSQRIPITLVPETSLKYMLDDFDYMIEKATVSGMILEMVWALYHEPERFDAWKGDLEIMIEEDGFSKKVKEIVYYVELKKVKLKGKSTEGLYI